MRDNYPWDTPRTYIYMERLFFDARREKMAIFSGCNSRPARLLQPVVVGAVEEVTNLLRPSM